MLFLLRQFKIRRNILQHAFSASPKRVIECKDASSSSRNKPMCQEEEENCPECPPELCCDEIPCRDGGQNYRIYRAITLFVLIPAILINTVIQYKSAVARHNECEERPEFVAYDHLRIRTKKFPWGDGNHTLFHNPRVNALPNGYEDENEEEDE